MVVIVLAALAGVGWWWDQRPAPVTPAEPVPVVAEAPPQPVVEPTTPLVDDTIKHPVEETAAPIAPQAIEGAVTDLVGRRDVARFLLLDDLAHRIVATVDNLGRQHAASKLWPVITTGGRFTVEQRDGNAVVTTDNAARYSAFLAFAEAIDTARGVELYRRFYPTLQAAYRELGYPKGYFNDRLVEVLDLLIETPEPEQPIAVTLIDVKGPIASTRPWVHYDYVDADLQSLTAGQKILLRMGLANERRAKAKLREVRAALVK
ncbi:DUF3014 domain-containing protein [soil metagenome]